MIPLQPRKRFLFRSVRTQILFWNSLTLVLILGVLGFVLHYVARASLLTAVDRALEERTRRMDGPPPRPPFEGGGPPNGRGGGPFRFEGGRRGPPPDDNEPRREPPPNRNEPPNGFRPPSLEEIARSPFWQRGGGPPMMRQDGSRLRPRLINLKGKVLAPEGDTEPWDAKAVAIALQEGAVFTETTLDDEPVRVYTRRIPNAGVAQGVVQIPYSLVEVNWAAASVNRALLFLIPFALLSAGAGGILLTNRVLRPVREIRQTAERVGVKRLSERLPVEGDDEFAELSKAFNGMLSGLEGSFKEQERLVVQLQEVVQRQRRFTADASHELRTPLTVIKANTSLYREGDATVLEYQEAMGDIDEAANSMSTLVQDLLLLAQADGGQLGRGRVLLSVQEFLERAIANASKRAMAPIHLSMEAPDLQTEGDAHQLTRLFTNLLENAARYTPATGEICVRAQREGEQIAIRVSDNGVGIAPEHLAHLGERFYRGEASRAHSEGGFGLGLSICKEIAEAHKGSIHFQSEEGNGTIVTTFLPKASVSA